MEVKVYALRKPGVPRDCNGGVPPSCRDGNSTDDRQSVRGTQELLWGVRFRHEYTSN